MLCFLLEERAAEFDFVTFFPSLAFCQDVESAFCAFSLAWQKTHSVK